MAYDSDTYGQSPFGNVKKPKPSTKPDSPETAAKGALSEAMPLVDGGASDKASDNKASGNKAPDELKARAASTSAAVPSSSNSPLIRSTGASSKRKARSTSKRAAAKSTTGRATRKGKKTTAIQADSETAEAAIARRFELEDRAAYLSLLYKTGISALMWAVLRLSRYELPDKSDRIVNILIHPLLISACALLAMVGLTFWLRYLLNDLAQHTQQLHVDAEETSGKNYRPTLEIVGDALEYNPKFRKKLALFFNAASILICTLISYLITSVLLP
ncbi:MAG: hypothetical protein WA783_09355 [Phormidesmis sp.]